MEGRFSHFPRLGVMCMKGLPLPNTPKYEQGKTELLYYVATPTACAHIRNVKNDKVPNMSVKIAGGGRGGGIKFPRMFYPTSTVKSLVSAFHSQLPLVISYYMCIAVMAPTPTVAAGVGQCVQSRDDVYHSPSSLCPQHPHTIYSTETHPTLQEGGLPRPAPGTCISTP